MCVVWWVYRSTLAKYTVSEIFLEERRILEIKYKFRIRGINRIITYTYFIFEVQVLMLVIFIKLLAIMRYLFIILSYIRMFDLGATYFYVEKTIVWYFKCQLLWIARRDWHIEKLACTCQLISIFPGYVIILLRLIQSQSINPYSEQIRGEGRAASKNAMLLLLLLIFYTLLYNKNYFDRHYVLT